MVESAKLFNYLSKLSNLILSEIREKFKNGKNYKSERSITVPDFSELEYEDGRIKNFPKNKQVKKEFIDSFGLISDLTSNFILNLKEYKEVEKILTHQFKIQKHLISNFINKFVYIHVRNFGKEGKSFAANN